MAILKVTQHFEVTIGGIKYEFGSKTTPQEVTIGTEVVFVHEFSIASGTGSVTELWSDSVTADFDFMWVESDQDANMQLLASEDSNELGMSIPLFANKAHILHGDNSASGVIANVDTWETAWTFVSVEIDRIEYFQTSGSTAKVVVAAFT